MKYERNFYEIRSNDEILYNLKEELETIGYYSLHKQDVGSILAYVNKVTKDNIYIVGIGGSTLVLKQFILS